MAALGEHAVAQAVYVWRPPHDQPAWLVIFDFAEINGRIECIGMAMRSYIRDRAKDASGDYAAYWTGGTIRTNDILLALSPPPGDDWSEAESRKAYLASVNAEPPAVDPWPLRVKRGPPLGEIGYPRSGGAEEAYLASAPVPLPLHPIMKYDQDAVAAVFVSGELALEPRPLRAVTLREFPFGYCMNRARQQIAELYSGGGIVPHHAAGAPRAAQRRAVEKVVAAFAPKERKGGRPAKWTMEDLKEVARLYKEAWRTSTSPTKDVAIAMGIKANVAAKLVSRCRNPKIALLPPTERRKAGWSKSPAEARLAAELAEMEKPGKAGERPTNDGKETDR